jgi:hypothetical protein
MFQRASSQCLSGIRTQARVRILPPAPSRISVPHISTAARFSTVQSTVQLSYDLHEPAKPVTDKQTSPIIFMHGLFGSKKNNRTMSKWVSVDSAHKKAMKDELTACVLQGPCSRPRPLCIHSGKYCPPFPCAQPLTSPPRTSAITATRPTTTAMIIPLWPPM